jgi:hypothetical protein
VRLAGGNGEGEAAHLLCRKLGTKLGAKLGANLEMNQEAAVDIGEGDTDTDTGLDAAVDTGSRPVPREGCDGVLLRLRVPGVIYCVYHMYK